MDLSQMDGKDIQQIIDDLIETDDKRFLEALKQFKATGKPDAILQSKKLDALREDLKNIDLTKITGEQYKRLKNNYCEQTEFHHRTSISLSVLAVSIVAQGVFGGPDGLMNLHIFQEVNHDIFFRRDYTRFYPWAFLQEQILGFCCFSLL